MVHTNHRKIGWLFVGSLLAMGLLAQSEAPLPIFAPRGNLYVLNPGQTVVLEDYITIDEALIYRWDLGDGRTIEGILPAVSWDRSGVYQVSVTVENTAGQVSEPFRRWMFINNPDVQANDEWLPPVQFFNQPAHGDVFEVNEAIAFQGAAFHPQDRQSTLYWDLDDGQLIEGSQGFSKAYASAGTYEPKLFVVDDRGRIQANLVFAGIGIYEGVRPPQGRIVAPIADRLAFGQEVFQVQAGTAIQLSGEVIDPQAAGEPYELIWRVFGETTAELSGAVPSLQTWAPGWYEVFFHAVDSRGVADPFPDVVRIWVRDDNRAPETVAITEPNADLQLTIGEAIGLSGVASDLDGDTLAFTWSLSDGRHFEGQYIDRVVFEQTGLFQVDLRVSDSAGGQTTAARSVYVTVVDEEQPCTPEPLVVRRGNHEAGVLSGAPGAAYDFRLSLAGGTAQQVRWDFSHGMSAEGPASGVVTFGEPGWYPIRVFVADNCGHWQMNELWSVYIYGDNLPPDGNILEPLCEVRDAVNDCVSVVALGDTIQLRGQASDVDGNLPLSTRWYMNGSFLASGDTVQFTPDAIGKYGFQYFVTDQAGESDPFAPETLVRVIDPNLEPESTIILPDGDITVEPGQPIEFQALGVDPNQLELSFDWDFGPMANRPTARGIWVGDIRYEAETEPGEPHVVRLRATNGFVTEQTLAEIRVTVKRFKDEDFEPNDSFDTAPLIQQGSYQQLSLTAYDQIDVFQFEVAEGDRDLRVNLRVAGILPDVSLFRQENGSWKPVPLDLPDRSDRGLTLSRVPAGRYAIRVRELFGSPVGKRMDLSYGMSIQVLRPALYLPFLVEDGNLSSSLGIINPSEAPTDITLIGLDEQGNAVSTSSRVLQGNQRLLLAGTELFGYRDGVPEARAVTWVRVQATRRLLGFTITASADGTQLMSSGALRNLAPGVLVPHIAAPENGWYTRAILVNAQAESQNLLFRSPDTGSSLLPAMAPNSQQDFRFTEQFEGQLPGWGEFRGVTGRDTFSGIEIFGRMDQQREMAAIEMIDYRRNNPNFVYVANDLYFTHIAKDKQNWWTGISLINVTDAPVNIQLIGFDESGMERFRAEPQTLPAGGKLLKTASDLLGSGQADWLKVEADGRVAGFELFGDPGLNRLAGFRAADSVSDVLYFPHVAEEPGTNWTGISLVNVSAQTVAVRVQAIGEDGVRLEETVHTLGARAKLVRTAGGLFPAGLPPGTAYLKVVAPEKVLTGFELFGTLQNGGLGEQLAGLAALAF